MYVRILCADFPNSLSGIDDAFAIRFVIPHDEKDMVPMGRTILYERFVMNGIGSSPTCLIKHPSNVSCENKVGASFPWPNDSAIVDASVHTFQVNV
jgi:hypothetical protein